YHRRSVRPDRQRGCDRVGESWLRPATPVARLRDHHRNLAVAAALVVVEVAWSSTSFGSWLGRCCGIRGTAPCCRRPASQEYPACGDPSCASCFAPPEGT